MTRPRLSVRARLTLLYTGLFAVCGVIVVAVSYTLVAQLGASGNGQKPSGSDLAGIAARCRSEQPSAQVDKPFIAQCVSSLEQQQGAQHQRDLILSHLLLFSLISLMGYNYAVLLPLFAAQVLHGGAATLGWLTGASGIGALVSAFSLAVRRSIVGLTRMLQVAAAMLGCALILFGLSHTLWLSLVLMVFAGFGLMQGASVSNTIIQSLVTEDKRARVMSYYTCAFFGAAPFGNLLAGALAHRIGAPHTVIVTGVCCIAGSLWFTLHLPKVNAVMRPIYREMGLLLPTPPTERKNHSELV